MENKLQELTEKLYTVGVEKAKNEAEIIIADAQKEADRIIKNAKISKGSFYQYFVDKDEFYWYIVELVIKDNITLYDQLLEDNDGDIFLVEEIQLKELFKLFDEIDIPMKMDEKW